MQSPLCLFRQCKGLLCITPQNPLADTFNRIPEGAFPPSGIRYFFKLFSYKVSFNTSALRAMLCLYSRWRGTSLADVTYPLRAHRPMHLQSVQYPIKPYAPIVGQADPSLPCRHRNIPKLLSIWVKASTAYCFLSENMSCLSLTRHGKLRSACPTVEVRFVGVIPVPISMMPREKTWLRPYVMLRNLTI